MVHNTAGLLWTLNLYLPLDPYFKSNTLDPYLKSKTLANLEGTVLLPFFSRKPLKLLDTQSFAEVQFVIGSCRFISQSNYLNNCNNDCDWLILACLYTTDATFSRLENKVWFENSAKCVGK